jgi:deoxyribodipyrimidine photo-lyase
MASPLAARASLLNRFPPRNGRYVLYWMQASQRASDNPALDFAIEMANERGLPVLCVFGLSPAYPEANLRHFAFMLEGLAETRADLAGLGVQLAVLRGQPDDAALRCAGDAALVVCDRGYLRHQRRWRARVARESRCALFEVESEPVVPVAAASDRAEWSAATLRPKIQRLLEGCLEDRGHPMPRRDSLGLRVTGRCQRLDRNLLESLPLDRSVAPAGDVRGGSSQALRLLDEFLATRLAFYDEERNDPSLGVKSGLSPYLHFGQLSAARGARDPRPHRYNARQLEEGATHDPYWNAAMREMRITGRMHGYMRMYWGKKILQWSASPRAAFRIALRLNNRYFLDGRDPNSFAGVAWCFGLHDRPWAERPIFGTVRYMNDAGLRRKFDIDAYVARISALEEGGNR